MPKEQPAKIPVSADALASVYIDSIPVIDREKSSR